MTLRFHPIIRNLENERKKYIMALHGVDIHTTWRTFCKSQENIESCRTTGSVASIEKSTLISSDAHHRWDFPLVWCKRKSSHWRGGFVCLTASFSLLHRKVKSYRNRLRHTFLGNIPRLGSPISINARFIRFIIWVTLLHFLNVLMTLCSLLRRI